MSIGNDDWAAAPASGRAQDGSAGAKKRLMRTVPVGAKFAIVVGSVIVPLVALIAVGAFTIHADMVVQDAAHTTSGEALRPLYAHYRHLMVVALLVTGLTLAFSIWLTVAVSRRFAGAVTRLRVIAGRIADGKYDNIIDKEGDDEVSMLYASTARMQELLGEQESERARAGTEIARLQGGLNAASTNVMIADRDNRIVYMNDSVTKLFRNIETDLRKDLPRLDVAKMLGESSTRIPRTSSACLRIFVSRTPPTFRSVADRCASWPPRSWMTGASAWVRWLSGSTAPRMWRTRRKSSAW